MIRRLHQDSKVVEACHGLLEMILDGMLQTKPGNRFSAKAIADILTKLRQKCDDADFVTAPTPWRWFLGPQSALSNSQRLLSASRPNTEPLLSVTETPPVPEAWGTDARSTTATSTRPLSFPTEQTSAGRGNTHDGTREPLSRRVVGASTQKPSSTALGKRRGSDAESPGVKIPRRDIGSLPGGGVHSTQSRRLACPFFKHDPHKHGDQQTCCGPGWMEFHRVKYVAPCPN